MYSGSTLTSISGRILGAHQKVDRIARRNVEQLLPGCYFPKITAILHFEGGNGPDAIKRKSPSKDEPWHFLQPFDTHDTQLIDYINDHYDGLVIALRARNDVRAAFEAAWLAHAMVDGLTPAHHYPYEEKLIELRSGQAIGTRLLLKDRFIMSGEKPSRQLTNNWKMWGPKGLLTTHAAFEGGVATVMAPLSLKQSLPTQAQIDLLKERGLMEWFRDHAQEVANLHIYDDFYLSGWTTKLARLIRGELAPMLVRVVGTVWYAAAKEAAEGISQKR